MDPIQVTPALQVTVAFIGEDWNTFLLGQCVRQRPNQQDDHIQIHYYGISNRVKTCPFAATYKLAWTSCVPKRGKTGLEVLGDIEPKGEEDAKEKLEIIPVTDILMSGISLEKGKLSPSCSLQLKRKLFALRYQSVILII